MKKAISVFCAAMIILGFANLASATPIDQGIFFLTSPKDIPAALKQKDILVGLAIYIEAFRNASKHEKVVLEWIIRYVAYGRLHPVWVYGPNLSQELAEQILGYADPYGPFGCRPLTHAGLLLIRDPKVILRPYTMCGAGSQNESEQYGHGRVISDWLELSRYLQEQNYQLP